MMRRIFTLIVLFINIISAETYINRPQTIAIFDFKGNGVSDEIVYTLTDRLRSEIMNFKKITVVERKRLDAVMQEQKIQMSGCVDECLIELGKLLGSSSIIVGSIGKVGSYYTINARKINATTSEVESAISFDSKNNIDRLLVEGIKEVSHQLIMGTNSSSMSIRSISSNNEVSNKPVQSKIAKTEQFDNDLQNVANLMVKGVAAGIGCTFCVTLSLIARIILGGI